GSYSVRACVPARPVLVAFYRLLGMKAGARVQINTSVVADCNRLSIGDDTVIGGDVTLVGHLVEGVNLVCAPVKIGSRVTVGLMTVTLPGCQLGGGAGRAAHA